MGVHGSCFAFIGSSFASCVVETPALEELTTHWCQGEWDEARQIAEDRLAVDDEDLVGLLVMLDYHIEHLNLDNMREIIYEIARVGPGFGGEEFSKWFSVFSHGLPGMYFLIDNYPEDEYARDSERAGTKRDGVSMSNIGLLVELEEDGYFDD